MAEVGGPRECSIARTLSVLGERWTVLVLRELTFGVRRFDAIATATGAPRDILTRRLRGLEAAGLVDRRRYQDRPPRFEYHLTELGRDTGEVLLALMGFGDRRPVRRAPGALVARARRRVPSARPGAGLPHLRCARHLRPAHPDRSRSAAPA